MRRRILDPLAAAPLAALAITILAAAGCERFLPGSETPPGVSVPAAVVDATVPSSDGVPIHYRAEGSGAPALVFIHGWSCDATYWDAQMKHFAPGHRVVAIDLAGHGASGAGRAAWTVPAYAADVRAVVEALDLRRAVLIGHSMGGWIMLEAARLTPERVVALVAVDTLHDVEQKFGAGEIENFLAPLRADFRAGAAAFVRSLFPAGADTALVERVVADIASAPPEVAVPTLRAALAYDAAGGLRGVRVPVRCLNSDMRPTRVDVNRRYAERLDAVILAGVGHFPMLEATETFNLRLEEAVRDLVPAP